MKRGLAREVRTLVEASALSILASACYTPGYNSYATPRVTPERKIAAGFHVQVAGFSGELEGKQNQKYFAPSLPGVSGRVGLGGRWDTGFRAGYGLGFYGAAALHLGGDLKWLVLPGEALDIALNPALRFTSLSDDTVDSNGYIKHEGVNHWELDAPVVAGLNLSDALVVVVSPGVVLGWYSEPLVPFGEETRGRLVDGLAPRIGIGLNVRLEERLAMHPEATFVYTTHEANHRMIYTFGVAFQFGRLPPAFRAPAPRKRESAE